MYRICVFAGSGDDVSSKYTEGTKNLGKELAAKQFELIYGGASIGLMNILANSALENKGRVIGVMPKILLQYETPHSRLTQLHIVDSIEDRKKMMFESADAFIVLPGGIGTLEEAFEAWNLTKINFYKKPLAFFNIESYFNLLFEFLTSNLTTGLVNKTDLETIINSSNPKSLIELIYKKLTAK